MATVEKAKASTPGSTKKVKKVIKKVKTNSAGVNKKELDEKNLKNTVSKVVESVREVKYIYPSEVGTDQLKRKKHRAAVRAKNEKYLRDIADLERTKKDTTKIKKEYNAFRKANFLVP